MRYKEPFTLFPRLLESGKTIWYYQTYLPDGTRSTARSTGRTNKSAARAYCLELYRRGQLVPQKNKSFGDFSENFWEYSKCEYIKSRRERGHRMSPGHCYIQRVNFLKHVLPYFRNLPLDRITPAMIDKWLFDFKAKNLSNSTINHMLGNLRTILGEAVRKGLLADNPADKVQALAKNQKIRGILNDVEVRKLLSRSFHESVWQSEIHYIANILAASTGLRLGEIQALRDENVYPDYIVVKHSWGRRFGIKETKTGKIRHVPIPKSVSVALEYLKSINKGYLFSNDGGTTPIIEDHFERALYAAMEKIGISAEARKERNITFHSWRHFFNTFLRGTGVVDSKVKEVTGHSTQEMTEHYTKFRIEDLQEIRDAQEQLFSLA